MVPGFRDVVSRTILKKESYCISRAITKFSTLSWAIGLPFFNYLKAQTDSPVSRARIVHSGAAFLHPGGEIDYIFAVLL